MRYIFVSLLVLLLGTGFPALACSPNMEWVNKPFIEKVGNDQDIFLGKVLEVTPAAWENPGTVVLQVLSSRGVQKIGETVKLPYEDYGTCGNLGFETGEVWLYAGGGPFDPSLQPTASDLGDDNGADFEALLKRIGARLNPDYVPPVSPTKETAIIPGHYSLSQACNEDDRKMGYEKSFYDLTISSPDLLDPLQLYTVEISNSICQAGHMCSFKGNAPAYGFGELVVTLPGQTACSLIIIQNEQGTEVKENNPAACAIALATLDDCGAMVPLSSRGYLQKVE